MILETFSCGPLETNTYLVGCEKTKKAAVVDPAHQSFDILSNKAEELSLTLDKILLTHSHWDHIADVYEFKEKFQIPVYVHPLDAPNLENPGEDGLPMFFPIRGVSPDHLLSESESVRVGDHEFEVIHTPGHSTGGVCFYASKCGILLSGDTLFQGSIGNLSLSTSEPQNMWPSLKKLGKLPPNTKVYPGHGPSTEIGKEAWLENAKQIFGESI